MQPERRLKIAYLSHGSMRHTASYCKYFAEKGHDVCCITFTKPTEEYGVKLYDVSCRALKGDIYGKWVYLLSGWKLSKTLKIIAPDILHGHYVTSAGLLSLISGFRPYVLTAHGSDLIHSQKSFVWKMLLPLICRKSALVNVVSCDLADIVTGFGISKDKLLIETFGIEINKFKFIPSPSIHIPVRLLCTRMLEEVFDQQTIILACKYLKEKRVPFTLTFAAGGPLQNKLQSIVRENGLENQIRFLGGYDNKNLPELLHNHDVYLSASLWDGTSISMLETMACGVFPIVSRISSNQAWLEEGKNVLMFSCGNAIELADKIIQIHSNEMLRKSAILANRKIVEEKADREKNMSRLEQKYYEVLS